MKANRRASGAACLATTASLALAALASATSDEYVQTVSGQVRCAVSTAMVACERRSAEGFLQAPVSEAQSPNGGPLWHWNLAGVDSGGNFEWRNGNIGGPYPSPVLSYGQTYNINGWTIQASSSGTRFTNNATGRGMFVSIENVYTF